MAITGFVLSLLGVSLFGLIFSACAFTEINRGEKGGKGLAVAGLTLGIIGTVGWFIYVTGIIILASSGIR